MSSLMDDLTKKDAPLKRKELSEKIINYSGLLSLVDTTPDHFHRNTEPVQIHNYLVVLTAESFNSEKEKPRELSRHDVDSILSNRTFLYHKSETNLLKYDQGIAHFLLNNIQHYSINITREQLEGCILYFMMSDDTARIVFVPFS